MKLTEWKHIQRQGSEQQASKSVCQSSRLYEPPLDSRSFSETDDLSEPTQMKSSDQFIYKLVIRKGKNNIFF